MKAETYPKKRPTTPYSPGKSDFNLMKLARLMLISSFACIVFSGCKKDFTEHEIQASSETTSNLIQTSKTNIIIFLADDFGYELPTFTGGQSYNTPNLDFMAANGVQFINAYSHPDGYPSRLALYTGKYNFRNYTFWGQLPTSEKTIGNMLHDAGYATCFVGKWQCDGGDARIRSAGFDKYRIFQPFAKTGNVYQYSYKNPQLYENGNFLPSSMTKGKYSEDMYVDYVSKFIDSNAAKPFFVMFANNLPRQPWCPTPDDPEFATFNPDTLTGRGDKKYNVSMINYLDKTIGKVIAKVKSKGLANNTVIMFVGDDATNRGVVSMYNGAKFRGGKNFTSKKGTQTPLVVYWPGGIGLPGREGTTLIDYTDFLPTLAEIAGISKPTNYGILDGVSFYHNLIWKAGVNRSWVFCHWDNNPKDQKPPIRYVNNQNYKLYDTLGYKNFYNIVTDVDEQHPLPDNTLTSAEKAIKQKFETILQQMHK
ncbi:MAG TPA: sulfatase-like hydrolase/transferase [Chitinophagaceae bacterium]|jgi:arylsulfatase A